jgi:hypothetical protein
MESVFHSVSEIAAGKDGWRIRVRVLRMWEVPTFMKPDVTNSLEMVLIDEKVIYFATLICVLRYAIRLCDLFLVLCNSSFVSFYLFLCFPCS